MNTVSLKLKYAAAAFLAVTLGTLIVIGLLAWQHRADEQRLAGLAQGVTRDRVALELQARANAIARHVAESAGSGKSAHQRPGWSFEVQ